MAKKKQKLPVTAILGGVAFLVLVVTLFALVWFDVLPREISALWQRLLGILAAALAGVTVFEATRKRESAEELVQRLRSGQGTEFGRRNRRSRSTAGAISLPLIGDVSKALLGSIGAVILVGIWWLTPLAPVTVREIEIGDLTVPLGEEIAAVLLVMPDGEIAVCQPPVPPVRARRIAELIDDDAQPLQLALKAVVNGQHAQASKLLAAAAKGDAEPARIALARAQNAMYAGRFADAVKEYDAALQSRPDDPLLLCQAAVANIQAGQSDTAQTLVDRAAKLCEDQESDEEPDPDQQSAAAFCQHVRAVLCVGRANDFSEAEESAGRAREIWEGSPKDNQPLIAASLNNLAVVNVLRAEYENAEGIYAWARELWAKVSPEKGHANLATTLLNLATLKCRLCQLDEAEQLLGQVKAIRGENLPDDDPVRAVDLCAATTLQLARGQYLNATAPVAEALTLLDERLGPEHPLAAPVVGQLAEALSRQSLYAKADPYDRRAEGIAKRQWGDGHPFQAVCLNRRANRYLAQDFGQKSEALLSLVDTLHRDTTKIAEDTLRDKHPQLADALDIQGRLEIRRNEHRSARPPLQKALDIREEAFGDDHPEVAETMGNLASLNTSASMLDQGIRTYGKAIRTVEHSLGNEHPDLARLLYGQAKLHAIGRDFAAAKPLLERAREIQRKALPPFHPDLAVTLDACAAVLQAVNPPDPQAAEQMRTEAAAIREKHAEMDRPE